MEETSAPTFQLVVELGPHIGQTFTLSKASVSIGRAPGNDVVIEEPQVSRQHARLTRQGDLMVLEDLNSTNGTFVNGIRISGPHTLAHGDRIGLGDNVVLVFYGRPVSTERTVAAQQPGVPAASPHPAPAVVPPSPPPPPAHAPAAQPAVAPAPAPAAYPEPRKGPNWLMYGCGCVVALVIAGLVIGAVLYFFAPPEFWQALQNLLNGLGIPIEFTAGLRLPPSLF